MKTKLDVMIARISDHHPMVHDGVLFWNIMMQGKKRKTHSGEGYNNGFGIVESDEQYKSRLLKVAEVIASLVEVDPSIEAIGLCEGPVQVEHIQVLINALQKTMQMTRFLDDNKLTVTLHTPDEKAPNWGLLMLAHTDYRINVIKHTFIQQSSVATKLANRLQVWELTKNEKTKYFALGHFPFGGDEHVSNPHQLSSSGRIYRYLVNQLFTRYKDEEFIFCADFNFNPYLIGQIKDRAADKIRNNNSMVLMEDNQVKTVTVDGILLSNKEKQKYTSLRFNPGLFPRLKHEHHLLKMSLIDKAVAEERVVKRRKMKC